MNLEEFMEKVKILGKEFTMYEDKKKGLIFPLNTVHLLTRVDYLELTKEEYQTAKFQKKIDDLDYTIETVKRVAPKSEVTKKDDDKFTLVDKEVAVRKIWNVSNTAGAFKSFTNKEEAIEMSEEINNKILSYLK